MEEVVSNIFFVIGLYLSIGLVFGLIFISLGLKNVDEGSIDTSWKFKLLLIPGMLVFWPLFLKKWMGARS